MTQPHDDTTPVEHDPTGMRDLLAALPDPGPMPDDLVARITAALAQEALVSGVAPGPDAVPPVAATAHPRAAAGALAGGGAGEGDVIPLRPRRSRRLSLRHLGVAAAVIGVIGLGGVALSSLPGDLTASLGSVGGGDSQSAEDSSAGAAPAAGAKEGADTMAPLAPGAGTGEVVVVMSGTEHSSADLAVSARAVAEGDDTPVPLLTGESPGVGPIATPVGARACADALGASPTAGILVDVSDVDGRPAAVLVVHDDAGRTAYAVERSCTTGAPGLLAGPVPLP